MQVQATTGLSRSAPPPRHETGSARVPAISEPEPVSTRRVPTTQATEAPRPIFNRPAPNPQRPAWARRITAERENRNWNKAQFVHALQANSATTLPLKASVLRRVHAWESGDSCPDDFYKELIAKTFGIPVTAIWPELAGTRQWGGALNHTALLALVDDLTGRDLITALAAADTALEPGASSDEIRELALVGLIRIGLSHIRDHTQTTVPAPAPPPLDDAHSPNDWFTALASITRNSSAFVR